jgi:DNA-binding NtrC family response regulator
VLLVQLAQAILTRLGYEPVVYTSSIEALEAFRQAPQQIDLVMTDQTMPGLTGEDLVRELRAIRPDIPIILCTGFSYLMSAEKAAALGVQAFLMKPLEAREFDLTIRQILEQSQDQT